MVHEPGQKIIVLSCSIEKYNGEGNAGWGKTIGG